MALARADCIEYAANGALPSPMGGQYARSQGAREQGPKGATETGRLVETLSDSFPAIVDRYQAPLISFLYGMVGDREQAEDLTQDTFVKVYDALNRRHAESQFTTGWLFRVARNTAIDALRRRRLITWLPFGDDHERGGYTSGSMGALAGHADSSGDIAGRLADRELIGQVLARLPARYRECLLLRSVAGLSNGEIAQALHISVRNVNTTLFRARERFRCVYAELEDPEPECRKAVGSATSRGGS